LYIGDGTGWNFKFKSRIGSADTDRVTFFDNGNVTLNTGVITGNGSGLSAITGANVSGQVSYAAVANSVAGANVSGAVGLATYATTANAVAGANVSGQVSYAAVANSVAGANVTGAVGYATIANAVAGANVSGQVANALVAGTVYTAAQPNITSVGTLTSLTVSGSVNLQSTTNATSTTSGALVVAGGIGTNGNSYMGNTTFKSNVAYVAPNGANTITSTMLNGGTLAWSGNAGQLFSITDSMTGNIFTVNDVSGIPMISVDAGGNIQFAASGGFVEYGVTTGITAAGSTQGTATTLTRPINVISTVASGANGIILPTVPAGARILIVNTSANSLNVYPPSGAVVNSGSTNAAYSQPAGARLEYISTSTTQWYTLNATYG
jgi:hypothetical protein